MSEDNHDDIGLGEQRLSAAYDSFAQMARIHNLQMRAFRVWCGQLVARRRRSRLRRLWDAVYWPVWGFLVRRGWKKP